MSTYINNRRRAAAVVSVFNLVELARNTALPADIYQSDELTTLHETAFNICAWHNDIYSLQRELAGGRVNNLVVVLRNERDCSMQEALTEACAMINDETR